MRGILVSFLGADGIGKSTLVDSIAESLEAEGVKVRHVSWRRVIEEADTSWPVDGLQELWLEAFRTLVGGARTASGPLSLPRDYGEWVSGGWEATLAETELNGVGPAGPLASALVGLAGGVLLAGDAVEPALERGEVVLQETFPFKQVLKKIFVCRRIVGDDPGWTAVLDRMQVMVEDVFGSRVFQPDVGVLVDGPLDMAFQWRMAQSGQVGVLEDYRVAGDSGEAGYLQMQQESVEVFRRLAGQWDWLVHQVDGAGLESNLRRGRAMVLGHPALQGFLDSRSR
ncbi:hypothetical protein [Streptomyces sp. NBC_00091]|uniref:hypothetical protein n=1 Tax=Streptomyces sp. NBC_00091 TaxID=2975648 RepID=UPI002254A675|nr:hypothetical protein [Streptomyces sp. NBC_00091]MCX5379755.1 hypothetical protein [Streptomyces sp. NBC_00091]